MADLRCLDGSLLSVLPVPVLDREGAPYEVTLRLLRDGADFSEVGERCGWLLATTAARLREVRQLDPRAFPSSGLEQGLRTWATHAGRDPEQVWRDARRFVPRDRELLSLLSRDPDDLTSAGELRVTLREERRWQPGTGPDPGRWRLSATAVLDAWGGAGVGLRAVLDSAGLLAFLEALVRECTRAADAPEATHRG